MPYTTEPPKYPRVKGTRKIPGITDPGPNTAQHGYYNTEDGTRIFYSTEGEGPPLVFCYGLVCSSLHWTYQIDFFRRNYQCIWFDYRGHHNSDAPKDLKTLTVEQFARDIPGLLEELQIEKAVFLGHSMGVNVVLDFARLYPEKIEAIILANGIPRRPLDSLFHTNAMESLFKFARMAHNLSPKIVELYWEFQRHSALSHMMVKFGGFNPHLTAKGDIQLYVEQVLLLEPVILLNIIEDYKEYDCTSWVDQIKHRTLIFGGDRDVMTPLDGQELLNQLMPNSELEVVPGGAHCTQLDMPHWVSDRIEKFLNEMSYH